MMKVFWLNWILVFGALCWFASSVVLLVGFNLTTTFDESYYPGACIVRAVYYYNFNTSAMAYLDYQDPPRNFELKQNVTIIRNYVPSRAKGYMETYYPIGSHVGCLVSPRGLDVQIQDDGAFFIASLSLYICCAVSLAFYGILQFLVYKRRLVYREMDDDDPNDLTLYQNATIFVPGTEDIKTDFSYAQRMLWKHQDIIKETRFRELTDLQIKAIVQLSTGQDQEKFMYEVYKTLKNV